ncbi:MAG: hypothetical protein ABI877_17995, partial [Gemmatimonadaceae bacterium]
WRVKKLILLAVIVAACSRGPGPGSALTGAVAPRRAVEEFMGAVKAQDLQAMSVVWGTEQGPARDHLDRTELEKREIIMTGCYSHDRFRVLGETPGVGGRRMVRVEIVRANKTKTPTFVTVKGPSERWYVLDADFDAMRDFCKQ